MADDSIPTTPCNDAGTSTKICKLALLHVCWGLNSHCFKVGMVINLTVGVYIPITRIPSKGAMTIPNIRSLDPGKCRKTKASIYPSASAAEGFSDRTFSRCVAAILHCIHCVLFCKDTSLSI